MYLTVNRTETRDARVYPDWRWVAFWPGCEQPSGIGWSVNSDGDGRAFASACLARQGESLDRAAIDAQLEKLHQQQPAAYRALLRRKRLSPP